MSEKKEKSSKLTAVQKKLIIGIVCALLGLLLIGGGGCMLPAIRVKRHCKQSACSTRLRFRLLCCRWRLRVQLRLCVCRLFLRRFKITAKICIELSKNQ